MRSPLVALLLLGCVPKGRYLDLEASYDEAVAERDRAASEKEACEAELRDEGEAARERRERVDAVVGGLRSVGAGEVVTKDGRAVLRLRTDRLFAPDTADLAPEAEALVRRLAKALDDAPKTRFLVEAHAGAPPVNTKEFPTAWHLAGDRAIALVQALVDAGVDADRLIAGASDTGPDRVDLVWLER